MRKITLDQQTFKVRALKFKEIEMLDDEGIDLTSIPPSKAFKTMKRVFGLVFQEDELAAIRELDFNESLALWGAVLKETYGARDEEKNLSRSGNGSQTETE